METVTHEGDRLGFQRLEVILRELEEGLDPAALARAREAVGAILEIHRAGLEAMLVRIGEAGDAGRAIAEAISRDGLAECLLLLHGLHPLGPEARVRRALEGVRPYLGSHGGDVELLGLTPEGEVRLRLEGSCRGCPSSRATLEGLIEEAVFAAAPEVTAIRLEDRGQIERAAPPGGFVPLSAVTVGGVGPEEGVSGVGLRK